MTSEVKLEPTAEVIERCFICDAEFVEGDMVLNDVSGGTSHRACFGDDREGFCHLDTGEPLGTDEPLPEGYPYEKEAS